MCYKNNKDNIENICMQFWSLCIACILYEINLTTCIAIVVATIDNNIKMYLLCAGVQRTITHIYGTSGICVLLAMVQWVYHIYLSVSRVGLTRKRLYNIWVCVQGERRRGILFWMYYVIVHMVYIIITMLVIVFSLQKEIKPQVSVCSYLK